MSESVIDPEIPRRPTDTLVNFIITLLAPLFLVGADGDVRFARMAATETVNAFRIDTQADLITVAQIVALALSALGSLSLAMTDDIGLPMLVRLRGNANALCRTSEGLRKSLAQDQQDRGERQQQEERAHRAQAASQAPATKTQATKPDRQPEPAKQPAGPVVPPAVWASAVATVAKDYAAEIPGLPPAEQAAASYRLQAMTSTANQLFAQLQANPPKTATSSVELGGQPGVAPVREHPADMPGKNTPQR